MGEVRPAMVFNLVSYGGIGLPLGGVAALGLDYGLAGLWWGLAFGLACVAVLLLFWVRFGGPATVKPLERRA